jgi:hypothetical protein
VSSVLTRRTPELEAGHPCAMTCALIVLLFKAFRLIEFSSRSMRLKETRPQRAESRALALQARSLKCKDG